MDIYCVKIRQRRLSNRTYFPFERMYVVPAAFFENDYWKQVFPYMLVAESPKALLNILEKMDCDAEIAIETTGKPETRTRPRRTVLKKVDDVMPSLDGKRIVIPTYLYKKKLGYLWSYLKSAKAQGIELSLYMPDKVVPSMCYQCVNLSHKYAGECQLTDEKCRTLINLDLPNPKEDEKCQSDSDRPRSRKSVSQTGSPTQPS
jgi:hypothetical protein